MFSSEIRSFLQISDIKDNLKLNSDSINEYLSLNYLTNNKTFFKDIKSLKPASYILLDSKNFGSNITTKKYWFLENYFINKTEDSFDQASEKIDSLIKQSIKQKMFSDVNNGVFLSGGIDSSIISSNLKEIDNHLMSAHNISFTEDTFDEAKDAKIIAEHLKIKLKHIPGIKSLASILSKFYKFFSFFI